MHVMFDFETSRSEHCIHITTTILSLYVIVESRSNQLICTSIGLLLALAVVDQSIKELGYL